LLAAAAEEQQGAQELRTQAEATAALAAAAAACSVVFPQGAHTSDLQQALEQLVGVSDCEAQHNGNLDCSCLPVHRSDSHLTTLQLQCG
jgi:hypothetical protein